MGFYEVHCSRFPRFARFTQTWWLDPQRVIGRIDLSSPDEHKFQCALAYSQPGPAYLVIEA